VHFHGIAKVDIRYDVAIHQHEVIVDFNLGLTYFSQGFAQGVGSFKFEIADFQQLSFAD
jgi:hypothetical protein